jgi:hypothetical protein
VTFYSAWQVDGETTPHTVNTQNSHAIALLKLSTCKCPATLLRWSLRQLVRLRTRFVALRAATSDLLSTTRVTARWSILRCISSRGLLRDVRRWLGLNVAKRCGYQVRWVSIRFGMRIARFLWSICTELGSLWRSNLYRCALTNASYSCAVTYVPSTADSVARRCIIPFQAVGLWVTQVYVCS